MMNFTKNARIFLHNMKLLSKQHIESLQWDNIQYTKSLILYGNLLEDKPEKKLHILDNEHTLDCLLHELKTFYRFGDAEINIMLNEVPNQKTCSQRYDVTLAKKLYEALTSERDDVYIGIGYRYFYYNIWDSDTYSNKFFTLNGKKFRDFFLNNCDPKRTYLATDFNQYYFTVDENKQDDWFRKVKLLFKGRKICLFMGEETYNNLKYYVFDEAEHIETIMCPSRDSFDKFDELFLLADKRPNDEILCFAIGPTSKVLCYELNKKGKICLDIGHLPKDYDSYMRKLDKSPEAVEKFYKGDYT